MTGKRIARLRAIREPAETRPPADGLRPWCLGGLACLVVATPLLPTETVQLGGSAMAMILLWLLLFFVWAIAGAAAGQLSWRGGLTLWMLLLFLAWHSLSALVMARYGQPRAAINMLWQWLSFGICFCLTRQLVRTAAERRALVAVMMAVAVGLSALGYYQYFREHPLMREQYRNNPEKVIRDAGIIAPAGTPQRDAFENRLNSTEPFATFALTNSLAGFLSPWLIMALGIGITNFSRVESSPRTKVATLVTAVIIAGCLVLTKSRTAWIAVLAGIALLAVYGRRSGWRPDWRIVTGMIAAAVFLPFLGFVIGGLDSFVILEASKAMLYRVQYWRSTAQMIADFPIFGCGPGNFQQYYTAYKLPEASETIAEPHNFIMEIWATAGTPALVLFVAFWLCFVWQVWRAQQLPASSKPFGEDESMGCVRSIYWGGLAGGLFAYVACMYLEGYVLSPGLLVFGFPLAAVAIVLWHPWVLHGRWTIAVPAIAIAVVLINLLAAGGISFASVANTLWVLAALVVSQAESQPVERFLTRRLALVLALLTLGTIGIFTKVGYLPQLNSQTWLADGDTRRSERRPAEAMASFRQAIAADPYSQDGWERLADLAHEGWLATGDREYFRTFHDATQRMLALNPRSSFAHAQVGRWWLAAYRHFGQEQLLAEAVASYGIATQRYPNYNLGHAELAWVLHLAGRDAEAAKEAANALRLDEMMPHQEQKLGRQRVYDAPRALPDQRALPGDRTAEQLMRQIRTEKVLAIHHHHLTT